jgi:hypothetical protein
MKWMKLFEDFKQNNEEGTLITLDDVIKCIREGGVIYSTIVNDLPDNDPEEPLKPISVDDDGLVTIEYDNDQYEVDLNNIKKIEF